MKNLPKTVFVRVCTTGFLIAAALVGHAQTPPPAPGAAPPVQELSDDQASYLFGLTFGQQLNEVGVTDKLPIPALTRGFREGLQGKKSTPAEQQQVQAYIRMSMQAGTKRNQTAAADFLEHNAHEKGVTSTASGLQYKILVTGDAGAPPIGANDEVTVQYRGKLLDGSEFDSSFKRGAPATFVPSHVIKGWEEALVLMKPGAKWQLFVPPALAYNLMPKPGIPAGSLLIFDIEVLSVKAAAVSGMSPAPAPAAAPAAAPAPAPNH